MIVLANSYYVFFVITFITLPIYAQDVCVKKSSCVCEFSNGTGIDLTPSNKSGFFTAQTYNTKKNGSLIELSTYYYHPCFDVLMQTNSTINNTCMEPLTICRHVDTLTQINATDTYKKDSSSYDFLGKSSVSNFTANGDAIIYFNGPSSTIILFVCAETDGLLQITSLDEPDKIVLTFTSRDVCLKQIDVGRSVGSTLLIVFFSLVIFYLVLGIGTKKFLMGATGIEVIPNLGFWSDLPNLVKDGWAFMINGFKLPARGAGPATSPDPNSYDSI